MVWNLDFISEEDFKKHVRATIMKYGEKLESYDLKRFNSNLIDPIKLIFDKSVYRTSWEEIVNNEIFRQRDKSNNNDIGYFHQNIFSYFKGCEVPQAGWDVIYRNPDGIQMPDGDIVHTIYVEMKNKHNTMNSASSAKTYLKDIILCLDEPEEIKTISQPSFISKVLNQSQKQAVMKALNTENICLIQGPPGTGKTSVIKEIVGQIIKRDIKMTDSPKILIVSQSHTAVDNILEGLGKAIDNPLEIIRIGAERNISEEIATKYTIAAHREQLVSEIKNNVQQYVEQKK